MRRGSRMKLLKMLRLIIILGFPLCLFLIWRLEPLLAKNIVVTTDYDLKSNPGLVKIIEGTRGKNILTLNTAQLAEDIKKQDIKIKEVTIQKKIPGQLLLKIIKRQEIAAISQGSEFLLMDKEGLVIGQKKEIGNLPLVNLNFGLQNLQVGSSIDNNNKIIFFILDWLNGKEKVVSVSKIDQELEIKLAEGTLIFFPWEDSEEKLASLQLLLTRFRIEGRQPVKIDLRFDKPVVTF